MMQFVGRDRFQPGLRECFEVALVAAAFGGDPGVVAEEGDALVPVLMFATLKMPMSRTVSRVENSYAALRRSRAGRGGSMSTARLPI